MSKSAPDRRFRVRINDRTMPFVCQALDISQDPEAEIYRLLTVGALFSLGMIGGGAVSAGPTSQVNPAVSGPRPVPEAAIKTKSETFPVDDLSGLDAICGGRMVFSPG